MDPKKPRDQQAADAYLAQVESKLSDLCGRGGDYDAVCRIVREGVLQGWHEAMVGRDEDDAEGVCQECGGTAGKHGPMCSQR